MSTHNPFVRGCLKKAAAALLLTAVTAGAAHAEQENAELPFTPVVRIGTTDVTNDNILSNSDGSFSLIGTESGGVGEPIWQLDWNLTVKQDPFILGALTITNLSTTARNFSVVLNLPATPAFSPSLYGGSITAVITDLNNDLIASLSPSTAPGASPGIYQGTIDGNPVLDLFAMTLQCTGAVGGCLASSTDQDGLPGPTLPGPGMNNSIGTLLRFNLSGGDRVVFDTNFTVVPTPVPLPAAAWLLIAGVGAMGSFARRRAIS